MIESFDLRQIMRRWPTGVAVVTTGNENHRHGMTVSSFVSIALDPPAVTVTMANASQTKQLVEQTGSFAVNFLDERHANISEIFAGKVPESADRFQNLEITPGHLGLPLLTVATAHLECKVIHNYRMVNSTLFVGEVLFAGVDSTLMPLVYFNREYWRIKK